MINIVFYAASAEEHYISWFNLEKIGMLPDVFNPVILSSQVTY
jgi:hypothetical protein